MSGTTDYLPFATSGGANVDTQANYLNSSYQLQGFQNGVAFPFQANKVWRQTSMVSAAVANLIANTLNINLADDGNLLGVNGLLANLTKALRQNNFTVNVVGFSATPQFDCSISGVQEITLTGNVTSSTQINATPGQEITYIIHQDNVGGRTFVAPGSVPMDAIDTAANATSVQKYIVGNGGTLYKLTPMISQ